MNATELLVRRREWTSSQARSVRELFTQPQNSGVFRAEPLAPETWERSSHLCLR